MDVQFRNHGSIWLAQPLTAAAGDWIAEHIPEDAQYWGDAVVIEPRYVAAIAEGMANDGLEIE